MCGLVGSKVETEVVIPKGKTSHENCVKNRGKSYINNQKQ